MAIDNSLRQSDGMISGDLQRWSMGNCSPERVLREVEELIEERVITDELAKTIHLERFDGLERRLPACARIVPQLMGGAIEQSWVVEEAIFSAIAVMNIEILWIGESDTRRAERAEAKHYQNSDSFDAVSVLSVSGADARIVHKTKPHGA